MAEAGRHPVRTAVARRGGVRFGTSGWRAVLGEGFTFERARAVARAVAERVRDEGLAPRVVVAHDTRFAGDRLAESVSRVIAGAGLRVLRSGGSEPTPVATHAVRRRRAGAGIILTASHNPPEYQGLKLVSAYGGAALPDETRDIERRTARILARGAPPEAVPRGRLLDLRGPYLDDLLGAVDVRALRRHGLRVIYDALHGSGAGVLDRALARAGVEVRVRRATPDPLFGGGAPDPRPERLRELARELRAVGGLSLGLATDGDADRFAAVDGDGRVLEENEALALLVDHLARQGRLRRGVALSPANGMLVEKVALAHGLAVERVPFGFKHLARALLDGRADVAGDESGGFAWAPLTFDKDGMLASLLLSEIVATTRAPLRESLRRLEREHGRSACGRLALPFTGSARDALARIRRAPPGRVDRAVVRDVQSGAGLRIGFDDGFLMLRASGTEPVVRVYAEAAGPRRLSRRLAAGARLFRRAHARG